MAQLAAEKIELEKRIRALPLNHDFMGEQNPEEALRISKVALQRIEEEKTRLEQGRVGTLALFTQFPEDISRSIMDQASLQTKMALSHVSHVWKNRSIESLRHKYDCFIQQKLDEYIQSLSPTEDAVVSHSSDAHLQEVLLELEAIQKEHILLTTPPTFQNLREKLIEVRNRVYTTLDKLDDVSRIPRTIVPSEQDSRYLPSITFKFIDVMLTERRGRVSAPPYLTEERKQWTRERMTIAKTLIKMGDTKNALQFIEEGMSNSCALDCIKLLLDAHDITSAKAICFRKFTYVPAPPPKEEEIDYEDLLPQAKSGIDPDDIKISGPMAWRLVAVAEATKYLDRVLQHGNLEEALREEGLNETLETIATLDGRSFTTYIDAIYDIAGAIAKKGDKAIAIAFAEKKLLEKGINIRSDRVCERIAGLLAKAPPRRSGGLFSRGARR